MSYTLNPSADDCYFYYYSSCSKGDACSFRHCEAALGSETVCMSWRNGQCAADHCMYRHMEIQNDRSNILCYWERQPGGCRKPHCVFRHTRPRDESGTLLSEEEKLAALTSPPPQMAMPMVEDPPDIYNIPVLLQDRSSDSPTVERVVINPFEEETDEESVHGTPVKSSHVTRVEQLRMQAKPKISKMVEKENSNNGEELNFSVKSLEEIRQEKLERAKRLIEEADNLLSQEDPELLNKVEDVKKKLAKPQSQVTKSGKATKSDHTKSGQNDRPATVKTQKDSCETSNSSSKVIKISVKKEEDEGDLGLKSYEEILREKALASMMRAKAKKLEEQRKKTEPPQEQEERHGEEVKQEDNRKRRVVVRRISGESEREAEHKAKPTASKLTAHSRLGDKANMKGRVATEESKGSKEKPVQASSIKSRLGKIKPESDKSAPRLAVNNDNDNKEAAKQPRITSIKNRLGIQRTEAARKPSPVPVGNSDSESEIVREKSKVSSIKSRLGVQRVKLTKETSPAPSVNSDSESELVVRQSRTSVVRNRLATQKEDSSAKRHSPTTITMSDFSSDGMTETESESEEVKVTKSETEKMKVVRVRGRGLINVKNDGEKLKLQRTSGGKNDGLEIKSLDEILKRKALKNKASDYESESPGSASEEEEEEPLVEVKPRTINLGRKRKVTLPDTESSPPKMTFIKKIAAPPPKTGVRRRVEVCTEDTDETERDVNSRDNEYEKIGRKKVVERVKPRVKGEKRAPRMQVYRPPALKEKEDLRLSPVKKKQVNPSRITPEPDEEEEEPAVKRKNKNWAVKTFSEILREKQLKREQQKSVSVRPKPSLQPLSCDQVNTDNTSQTKKKSIISPIKFGTDDVDGNEFDNVKETVFKVAGFTKKRSHSPEDSVLLQLSEGKVPESSSQTSQITSKKTKCSNVWSTRTGERSVQGQGEMESEGPIKVSISGARKLSIQKRLGKINSAVKDKLQKEYVTSSISKTDVSSDNKDEQLLFGKPKVKVDAKEKILFRKKVNEVNTEKIKTEISTGSEKVQMLFGKPRVDVGRKETEPENLKALAKNTSTDPSMVSFKSPLTRVSAKPVKKPSTPKLVTPGNRRRSSASAVKDGLKSPSGPDPHFLLTENDESLNLEDTLEDELVQLLGGDGKDMVAPSTNMELDPDEDLLKEMEELLA